MATSPIPSWSGMERKGIRRGGEKGGEGRGEGC